MSDYPGYVDAELTAIRRHLRIKTRTEWVDDARGVFSIPNEEWSVLLDWKPEKENKEGGTVTSRYRMLFTLVEKDGNLVSGTTMERTHQVTAVNYERLSRQAIITHSMIRLTQSTDLDTDGD